MKRWACGVTLSAVLGIAAACAQGQDGIDIGDGDPSGPDGGGGSDARLPSGDGGGGGKDGSVKPNDDSGGPGPGCTGKVVINELMTGGSGGATQEFVELYNPNNCAVSLGSWKLAYKSQSGSGNGVLHAFGAGDSIPAESFFVAGTASFSGQKDATMNGGMSDTGGQVGLVDDTDKVVDALGYGGATGPYVEGSAAGKPPSNGSVGRKSDGLDTDNNAADCKIYNQHSAGAPNP